MLDDLPTRLTYLKAPAEDIANQDQDLIGSGEVDTTAFETALRREMASLPLDEADIRCVEDLHELNAWLQTCNREDDRHVLALWVISGLFTAAHEILNPTCDDDDDERCAPRFEARLATMQLSDHFTLKQSEEETFATDGVVKVLVREIDAKSFTSLSDDFSTPKRKTKAADGTVVYPKQAVKINKLEGTKNLTINGAKAEITYLLKADDWFAMVRIDAPSDVDVTPYEVMLGSIVFR